MTAASVRLRAQRPAGPVVRFDPAPDELAEAEAVADAIGALLREASLQLDDNSTRFQLRHHLAAQGAQGFALFGG